MTLFDVSAGAVQIAEVVIGAKMSTVAKERPSKSAALMNQGEPMTRLRLMPMPAVGLIALVGGCATRPINPPITHDWFGDVWV